MFLFGSLYFSSALITLLPMWTTINTKNILIGAAHLKIKTENFRLISLYKLCEDLIFFKMHIVMNIHHHYSSDCSFCGYNFLFSRIGATTSSLCDYTEKSLEEVIYPFLQLCKKYAWFGYKKHWVTSSVMSNS